MTSRGLFRAGHYTAHILSRSGCGGYATNPVNASARLHTVLTRSRDLFANVSAAEWSAGRTVVVGKRFCMTGGGSVLAKRLAVAKSGAVQGLKGKRTLMAQTGRLIEKNPFVSQVL